MLDIEELRRNLLWTRFEASLDFLIRPARRATNGGIHTTQQCIPENRGIAGQKQKHWRCWPIWLRFRPADQLRAILTDFGAGSTACGRVWLDQFFLSDPIRAMLSKPPFRHFVIVMQMLPTFGPMGARARIPWALVLELPTVNIGVIVAGPELGPAKIYQFPPSGGVQAQTTPRYASGVARCRPEVGAVGNFPENWRSGLACG